MDYFGYALIFGSIIYLAYVATRFIGKKTSASMQSRHMRVIEQISLGLDRKLLLVRVGNEHFLFLCGRKEFRQVARVNLDTGENQEGDGTESQNSSVFDFRQIFDKTIHNLKDKKEQMKKTQDNADTKTAKDEPIQRNIRKLEQLREKSHDKEV